jgi:hypothetical protein
MSLKEEKRAKAKRLIEQALDDSVGPEERNAFAVRAIKIIDKYELLTPPPLDGILENETVRAVKTVADKFADPELVGGLKALFGAAKSAAAEASSRRRRR